MNNMRYAINFLSVRERISALWVFLSIVLMGLTELLGVVSIVPFVAILGKQEIIHENQFLANTYELLNFTNDIEFLFFLGAMTSVVVVFSLLVKIYTEWSILKFAQTANARLSRLLFQTYLHRPYSFYLGRHSANLSKAILAEVRQVINGAVLPALNLTAGLIISILLIGLILYNEPYIGTLAMIFIGGGYSFIYLFLRGYIEKLGQRRLQASRSCFRIVQEALNGIKDVKALQLEEACHDSFVDPIEELARVNVKHRIFNLVPGIFIQGFIFIGMMVIVLYTLTSRSSEIADILPTIVLFAVAGSRIQGAMNQIFQALTSLRFSGPAIEALHKDLTLDDVKSYNIEQTTKETDDVGRITLEKEITLSNISFTYSNASKNALKNISLTIPARANIAFVGSTGAGKTTLVDIILTLLAPESGQILADSIPITSQNLSKWKKGIGYVSQSIFLKDDTIAANIAFGRTTKNIDMEAVRRAAKQADLHEFVTSELTAGYNTVVGDRGVRLSGGQRQRIGIARALYTDPSILILDEATSALDNLTERTIMDTIKELSNQKTVITIAHRFSTIQRSDLIFFMHKGQVERSGTYNELIKECPSFREMALTAG